METAQKSLKKITFLQNLCIVKWKKKKDGTFSKHMHKATVPIAIPNNLS